MLALLITGTSSDYTAARRLDPDDDTPLEEMNALKGEVLAPTQQVKLEAKAEEKKPAKPEVQQEVNPLQGWY